MWGLESGRGIQTLRGLPGQIAKVSFSADGKKVAALSHNWEVGIWNLVSGQLLRVFEVPSAEFADNAALVFSPNGERLAFAAAKTAKMWNIESGTVVNSWDLWPGLADELSFPDENHLLLGRVETFDGIRAPDSEAPPETAPRVYRIRNLLASDWRRPVAADPYFNRRVSNNAATRDGRFFVVEGAHGQERDWHMMIKAYDGFTGKEFWRFPSTRTGASWAILDASGKLVAFQTDNTSNAVMVDLASGSPIKTLPWLPAAIGPEGGFYAVGDLPSVHYRGCSLFKDAKGTPLVTLGIDGGPAVNAAFDPAGNQLAWGNTDGSVTVCDLKKIRERLGSAGLAW